MRKLEKGVDTNDRKFEAWKLKIPIRGTSNFEYVKVQVYAVPDQGYRGCETSHFKVVVDGKPLIHENINELRKMATLLLLGLKDDDYEKVLIIRIDGWESSGDSSSDSFGIAWKLGWKAVKLDVIYNDTRQYIIRVDNESDTDNKTAVVKWTAEREAAVRAVVKNIGRMRDMANKVIMEGDFEKLLDDGGKKLLSQDAG